MSKKESLAFGQGIAFAESILTARANHFLCVSVVCERLPTGTLGVPFNPKGSFFLLLWWRREKLDSRNDNSLAFKPGNVEL